MRVGLITEKKLDFKQDVPLPADADSELLALFEYDELCSGLMDAGHHVVEIGDYRRLIARPGYWHNRCDIVLNRSVGYTGMERKIFAAAVLEAAGIPYIGSTPAVQMLSRHKFQTKLTLSAAGLPTPPAALVRESDAWGLDQITYPAIVKPVAESSSIGIEHGLAIVVNESAARKRAHEIITRYHQPAIVETFVRGIEVEVPIVTDPRARALGVSVITIHGDPVEGDRYLSSDLVYSDVYDFAKPVGPDLERIERVAVRAAEVIGIRDYGRIDLRVTDDGTPWIIESSTTPHLQRHSSFAFLAKEQGLAHHELLDLLVRIGARRYGLPKS